MLILTGEGPAFKRPYRAVSAPVPRPSFSMPTLPGSLATTGAAYAFC